MNHNEPFHFYTERRLVELTGKQAKTLAELRALVEKVPGSSIFYHTHHMFLSHHFEKPVVPNDFSVWVTDALQEDALGEKLAALDLLSFTTIRHLREAILALIGERMAEPDFEPRRARNGDAFHFCQSQSFIMRTGEVAHDVAEFFQKFERITNIALYFHLLEARLRLGRPTNDFSAWLEDRGEPELAKAIDTLDPYGFTLDELKAQILEMGRKRAGI